MARSDRVARRSDRVARRSLRLAAAPRNLRAGFAQLLFAVAGAAGGLAAARITGGPAMPTARVVDLLVGVGFGVLGVASILFSLLFLVVQWADSHLTPRLTLFREAPIVWRTFAFVVGIFVFCVVTVLALGQRSTSSGFIPVIALGLVMVALALIARLQSKAFDTIQLAPVLDTVTARGEEILRAVHDGERGAGGAGGAGDIDLPPRTATVAWPRGVCVLKHIDVRAVVAAAERTGTVVVMRRRIGAALRTGVPVADIHGGALPPEEVLSALIVGPQPTFGQDPLLAFRLIADIALRALSTAVNDPATAVQAIDHLDQLLSGIAGRPRHNGAIADATGAPRLLVSLPTWDDYLTTALADIVATVTARTPMVIRRLVDLIEDMSARVEPADRVRLDRWRADLGAKR